jgi:hypothetical protein
LLALEMLDIGVGDTVLVPTYHCPTMIAPIIARGAQAMFYPLEASGAPLLEWIRQAYTPRIRAIVVAHFFGIPQPLSEVRQWCDQQGVRLIEDCAHGLFGTSGERALGCWGDVAIASLTKFFPIPEGGCLINNTVSAAPVQLRQPTTIAQLKAGFDIVHTGVNHDRLKGLRTLVRGMSGLLSLFRKKSPAKAVVQGIVPMDGFTIDPVRSHQALTHACRWVTQHMPWGRIVMRRRVNYRFLVQALAGLPGVRPLRPDLPESCAPYVFPLWVDQPDPGYLELRHLDFPVARWDRLWPTVCVLEEDAGVAWSHHVLQIACHQDLTPQELQHMVDTVKQVFLPKRVTAARPQSRGALMPTTSLT